MQQAKKRAQSQPEDPICDVFVKMKLATEGFPKYKFFVTMFYSSLQIKQLKVVKKLN